MSELDDLLAEKARRQVQKQPIEIQPPPELQEELAQQAQNQAFNPQPIQEVEPEINMDVINRAVGSSNKKTAAKGIESMPTYDFKGKQIDVSNYPAFINKSQATPISATLAKTTITLKQLNHI